MSEVVEQIVTEEQKEESTDQNTDQPEEEQKPKRGRGRPKKEKPPPPPKPPKIKKTEDMKAYMREYLKKYYVEKMLVNRSETVCENCKKNFNTLYALKRHNLDNRACQFIKMKRELETLKNVS